MKNLVIVSITALLFGMMFTSCKKDTVTNTVTVKDTVLPVPNIVGFWPGLAAGVVSPQTEPNEPLAFLFNSNGTFRLYLEGASETDTTGAVAVGTGTYTLTGLTLNFAVTINSQNFDGAAMLDSSLTFFQSTIGVSPATTGNAVTINYKDSKY